MRTFAGNAQRAVFCRNIVIVRFVVAESVFYAHGSDNVVGRAYAVLTSFNRNCNGFAFRNSAFGVYRKLIASERLAVVGFGFRTCTNLNLCLDNGKFAPNGRYIVVARYIIAFCVSYDYPHRNVVYAADVGLRICKFD